MSDNNVYLSTDNNSETLTEDVVSCASNSSDERFKRNLDRFNSESGQVNPDGPKVSRSERVVKPVRYYGDPFLYQVKNADQVTQKVGEALADPTWKRAILEELDSMHENNVWNLSLLPTNTKLVKCRWVFKNTLDESGNIIQNKARLVAQGFTQTFGEDYFSTFSPVISCQTSTQS